MEKALTVQGEKPAYLVTQQEQGTPDNKALMVGGPAIPTISILGKQWRIDGLVRELGAPLYLCILGISPADPGLKTKAWYARAMVEGSKDAPDCSSTDGIEPDGGVPDRQADFCSQCPRNMWGSAIGLQGEPRKGKACLDMKLLFVTSGGFNEISKGTLYQLRIPPTSLSNLTKLGQTLEQMGCGLEHVVVKGTFADAQYPIIELVPDRYLDQDEHLAFVERAASFEVTSLISQKVPALDQVVAPESVPAARPDPPAPETQDTAGTAFGRESVAQGPTQPEMQQEAQGAAEEPELELDADGYPWDPQYHATGKDGGGIKNQDRRWRKRKGKGGAKAEVEPASTEPPPPPAAQQDATVARPEESTTAGQALQNARDVLAEPSVESLQSKWSR